MAQQDPEARISKPFSARGAHAATPREMATCSEFKSKINNARANRKRVESDVTMLANRIALLKVEMQKAQKKIVETSEKTQQMKKTQAENEQKHRERERRRAEREAQRRAAQLKFSKEKAEFINTKQKTRVHLVEQKQADVQDIKKVSQTNTQRIQRQREIERLKAVKNRNMIQKKREQSKRKLEITKRQQMEAARRMADEKLRCEAELARKNEMMISQMEQEELALIEALQKTQQVQKSAYEELEVTVNRSLQSRQGSFSDTSSVRSLHRRRAR